MLKRIIPKIMSPYYHCFYHPNFVSHRSIILGYVLKNIHKIITKLDRVPIFWYQFFSTGISDTVFTAVFSTGR
jgi:hypothetical protein